MRRDDVTPLMDGYRECVRHVWNCYFSEDAEPDQDWNLRDEFNAIAVGLFRSLVLRKLGREDVDVLPDHVIARQPLLFLRLDAPVGSDIHVNRSIEMTSGYWDDPVNRVQPDALDLRFLQYFDWSPWVSGTSRTTEFVSWPPNRIRISLAETHYFQSVPA